MSEIFNNIDRKTWREIKETLQWPPMENQLVVYTQLCSYYGERGWGAGLNRTMAPEDGRGFLTTMFVHWLIGRLTYVHNFKIQPRRLLTEMSTSGHMRQLLPLRNEPYRRIQ